MEVEPLVATVPETVDAESVPLPSVVAGSVDSFPQPASVRARTAEAARMLMAFFMVLFMVKFLISFLVFCLISCFLQVQCIQFRLKEKPKKDKVLVKSKFFLPLVFFPLYQKKVLDGKEKTA